MSYNTNANATINILSITASCRKLGFLLVTIYRRVLKRSQDLLVGWGEVQFRHLILK